MSTAMQQDHSNGFTGVMARPAEGRDVDATIIERVIVAGDLTRLSPAERVSYYVTVCRSVGLNPLTEPFKYIQLNGKLTLYSTKNCTDQLRAIHQVSVESLRRETDASGIHVVTATVKTPAGRLDEDIGAVSIKGLQGENLANALMKATTKAKRRATLSICGLSFVDESELEAIADASHVTVDQDGVIIEGPGVVHPEPAPRATVDGGKLMAHWFDLIDRAENGASLNVVANGVSKAHRDGVVTDEQKERVAVAVKTKRALISANTGDVTGKEPMFDGQAAADAATADLEREPGEEG